MVNANLEDTDLSEADFTKVDLTNSDFSNANLFNVKFTGATLNGAIIDAGDWDQLLHEKQIVAIKATAITNENNPVTNDLIKGKLLEDVIFAGEVSDYTVADAGNDTVHLSSSDIFVGLSIARNTTTNELISVEGMRRFSSVIDVGEDVDTIYLTDSSNGDAFFLHGSYSGLHESITAVNDGFGR